MEMSHRTTIPQPLSFAGAVAANADGDLPAQMHDPPSVAFSARTVPPTKSPIDGEQVYFNLPGVAMVRWDSPSQSAYIEWQGWAKPAEFRAANDALVQAITYHRSSRVLGDSRRIKVIQKTDQEWVNQDWFPRILAAGLTRLAMVLPASGLAKMNIDDMVGRVADRLDVAYFPSLDKARTWLALPPRDAPTD
jgi:hypothetical protein